MTWGPSFNLSGLPSSTTLNRGLNSSEQTPIMRQALPRQSHGRTHANPTKQGLHHLHFAGSKFRQEVK